MNKILKFMSKEYPFPSEKLEQASKHDILNLYKQQVWWFKTYLCI